MILDQFGRPLQRVPVAELLERQAVPTLGSVRQVQSGHPADDLGPRRLAAILREAEIGDATAYLELAEQMEERDLHYAAVLGVRKRAIRSLEIQVDPGDESEAAAEAAEMTRAALDDPGVTTALIDVMDALGRGFSVSELIWEREGKGLRLAGLERVDPRWFEFDRDNGAYIYLRDNAGPQPLRPDSFVIHLAKAKSGLAIRGGLARLAAWAFLFKHYSLKDWSIFMEAYGHPLRLGRYGTSSSPEDRATLLRAVRQIGVDMAAIIPKEMEMEIVSAAATGADKLYEGSARYWDEQLSKGVLGQVATTDALAGGHAVGKIHEEVRGDIRDADAEQLAASLGRDVVGAIVRLNFEERHRVARPIVRFVSPERADPKLMLELMEAGPRAGLRIAVSQIREVFALREPEDGEEVLEPPRRDVPDPPDGQPDVPSDPDVKIKRVSGVFKRGNGSARGDVAPDPERPSTGRSGAPADRRQSAARDGVSARDSIDAMIDELIEGGDMQQAMQGEIGELIEAIRRAGTFEEVQDVLAAFDRAGPGPVGELLTRSTAAARLAGEVGAAIRDA